MAILSRVTKGRGYNWQPDWSPDGKYIAYRSEDGDGGLFIVPALGGEGLSRKVAPFGYSPRWSPDGSEILFQLTQLPWTRFFVVSLDGSQPHEILTEFMVKHPLALVSAAWHPDGMRVTVWAQDAELVPSFWTVPVLGGEGVRSEVDPQVAKALREVSMGGIMDWAEGSQIFLGTIGKRDLFRAHVSQGKKSVEDDGRTRDAEGACD